MKVICNRGALLEALTVAGSVVASRTPKPVLQCVKLTAANDKLVIAATDLEVAVRYSDTQVQIEQPGETLVSFEDLFGTPEGINGFNDLSFSFTNTTSDVPVPEPTALALLGAGLFMASRRRRRW